jgi:TRAP-type C4-dicarboxylate transport system permease small subunit
MRKALTLLYTGCGVFAGAALVSIVACVLLQIVARLAGVVVSWTAEVAGYSMAASSFMGLAYTLNSGGHIRVTLLLKRLSTSSQRWFERACLGLAVLIIGYFGWWTFAMVWDSWQFNEMGQGIIAIPLWIPQLWMAIGLLALWISLLDNLVCHLIDERTRYPRGGDQPSSV